MSDLDEVVKTIRAANDGVSYHFLPAYPCKVAQALAVFTIIVNTIKDCVDCVDKTSSKPSLLKPCPVMHKTTS